MSTGCVLVCVMRLCSARDVPSRVIWEINEGTADVVPHRAAKAIIVQPGEPGEAPQSS